MKCIFSSWTDNRLTKPWIDAAPWTALKPTYPWGQVPCLEYQGQRYFQSMAICRFLARELGIAGNNNSEAARVDEIVDAIQDAVDATVSRIFLGFSISSPIFSLNTRALRTRRNC